MTLAKKKGKRLGMAEQQDMAQAPRALTLDEAIAQGGGSACPICKALGNYEADQSQDDAKWQDATCENGHAWREIWTLTHIVALDPETDEEIGEALPVIEVRR